MRGTDTEATAADRTFYTGSGFTLGQDTAYTVFAIFKPTNNTTADILISRLTDTSNRITIQVTAVGNVALSHGSTALIQLPAVINDWNYVIASFDGTSVYLNVNGADAAPVTAAGGTGAAATSFSLGTAATGTANVFDGQISDAMIFSESILTVAAKKQLLLDYAAEVYGV